MFQLYKFDKNHAGFVMIKGFINQPENVQKNLIFNRSFSLKFCESEVASWGQFMKPLIMTN
jgi:hypothetical protein